MSNNVQFTPNQLKLIDWLASPKMDRQPMTRALFADKLKVNEKTLRRWRELPGFMDAVITRSRELLKSDLPEIYDALAREAKKGGFNHIKLAMEMTGEHTDKSEQTITSENHNIDYMTHDEWAKAQEEKQRALDGRVDDLDNAD